MAGWGPRVGESGREGGKKGEAEGLDERFKNGLSNPLRKRRVSAPHVCNRRRGRGTKRRRERTDKVPGERMEAAGKEAREEEVEDRSPAKRAREQGVEAEDDGKVEGVPAGKRPSRADKRGAEGVEEDLEDAGGWGTRAVDERERERARRHQRRVRGGGGGKDGEISSQEREGPREASESDGTDAKNVLPATLLRRSASSLQGMSVSTPSSPIRL